MTDLTDYRRRSRARWGRSAPGWEAWREAFGRATMPVSTWMVDALKLQPGHDVLELAAGLGDTGFLAAELIRPGGTLICSDFSPEMLTAAQARAEELGIRNVRFRQIDAETIDHPAASLDGVLCRWGYMLMADGEAALRETRRVLRPGGRVALAAWADPDANPWSTLPGRELVRRGLQEPIDPAEPGQFAWAGEGVVAERLEAAGFPEAEVEALDFTIAYASADEWWRQLEATSMRFGDAVAALDAQARAEVREALAGLAAPHAGQDGSLRFPARTWVAVAVA